MDTLTAQLVRIGCALSSTRDLPALLDMILTEARALARADAGSVYLVSDGALRFETSQNETLFSREGEAAVRARFSRFRVPMTRGTIAGFVAVERRPVNIPDAYCLPPDAPFSFDPSWDDANAYRTRSILAVPMTGNDTTVVGVLQLINAGGGGGAVSAFPVEIEPVVSALASQAAVAIVNARLTGELHQAYLDSVLRLGVAAEFRDRETSAHIRRVSEYAVLLGRGAGLSPEGCEILRWAAAMHDTGKLGIPDAILHKPGPLTPEERADMETHTLIGALILREGKGEVVRASREVALTHHEKWDGTGYPRGLRGEAIPLFGRIAALADVYDALSSRRVYKGALPEEEVASALLSERGRHFDPDLVDSLLAHPDEYRRIRETFADPPEDPHSPEALRRLTPADLL